MNQVQAVKLAVKDINQAILQRNKLRGLWEVEGATPREQDTCQLLSNVIDMYNHVKSGLNITIDSESTGKLAALVRKEMNNGIQN